MRQTAMTASFLRASLFTSVVAFGVAFMAFGLGLVLILIGWALTNLAKGPALQPAVVEATGPAHRPNRPKDNPQW